ncbi:MAG: N-acetylmuramoyl-L-alanine amidase family protein [Roseburia sp.]
MSGTNGYQSTKLNKNRDVRKRSGIKTDLTGMQHPGAAGQHSRTASSDAAQRQRSRTASSDVAQRQKRAGDGREQTEYRRYENGSGKRTQMPRDSRRARERYRRRRRKVLLMQISFLLISVAILTALALLIRHTIEKKEAMEPDAAAVEEEIKSVLADVTDDRVSVSKYYVYGTHLNLEGTLTAEKEIQSMELLLVDDAKGVSSEETDDTSSSASAVDEAERIYTLTKTIGEDGSYAFQTSANINDGVNLENIPDGNYCMLLRAAYSDGTHAYYSLTDASGEQAITYYTLTKDNSNQKIQMSFAQDTDGTNLNYLEVNVAKSALPDDVYDIVIDAGHGGKDTGASGNGYTESELTLQYAKALKSALEDKGYKIKLTRDGSEPADENMAYTMYDEDGRVSIACRSGAKYCLCLHLNSNAEKLTRGGVQIYCSIRGNGDFAKLVADGIVAEAGTGYSNMQSDRVTDGVYAAPYSEKGISKNVATAEKYGYTPYDYSGVDSLFMIRELGGIATGAFVDGRDTRYGSNEYRNSNTGVETLLIELGYISIDEDLKNIISNQKGYVKGIVDAVETQVENQKTS